jgi:antitoxin component HigA of HigAB toxin-antitoxin module
MMSVHDPSPSVPIFTNLTIQVTRHPTQNRRVKCPVALTPPTLRQSQMERQGMTKARLAELMHTSRAQVDRILKAKGNVTVETLQRAAALVGRELRLELV